MSFVIQNMAYSVNCVMGWEDRCPVQMWSGAHPFLCRDLVFVTPVIKDIARNINQSFILIVR